MARIESVAADLFRVPLPETLTDSTHGEMRGFEVVILRVRDADGAEGIGWTYTCGRNGGAIADLAGREIPEIVADEDADLIEARWRQVWRALHYGGRGGPTTLALSAFDMALWDLKARRADLPLWRLLGGHAPDVSCYAGGIDLMLSAEELLEQTERNLARGFRAIKMKVGRDSLAEDVAKVAAMRDRLGAEFPLMLDANMVYTADEAIRAARAFAEFRPLWFEEPIDPDDFEGHARVQREGGLPLAAGENLRALAEFRRLIAADAVAFPEPDVTNCGGVTVFMKVAALAEAFNLPVTSHGAHDVTVHLLAACPNGAWLEAHGFGLDACIAEPLALRDGRAVAPERPGHGMEFDLDRLARLSATA